MINFKCIKFRHITIATRLQKKDLESEADWAEFFAFVIDLVADWDFLDSETGDILPVTIESIDEMIQDQLSELVRLFNQEFAQAKLARTTPPVVGVRTCQG